jgi:organic radical activating enzyme
VNDERNSLEIVKNDLNEVGPGFCAAKWFTSTIWLGNGRTSSCHHPPAHTITHQDIKNNPSGLHNTAQKKRVRKQMIMEERPSECGYCWRVEDADPTAISDRYIKSGCIPWHDIYRNVVMWDKWPDDTLTITKDSYEKDYNPRILEISFDNLCNLSCSYCNSEFSSTWANDIKKNGGYKGLKTEQRGTWENAVEFDYDPKRNDNPYVNAFFEWYHNGLAEDLQELRVTGGEPLRSPSFWKFVDTIKNPSYLFGVNTNMIHDETRQQKLVELSNRFEKFELYTSAESYGKSSEFIRSGFVWDQWCENLENFLDHGNKDRITIMMTINALSIFNMVEFLDYIVGLKKKYNNKSICRMSWNILRFPNFQSINVLPLELKEKYSTKIENWLEYNIDEIEDGEIENIRRTISYMRNVDTSYEDTDEYENKASDFKTFFTQYAERRNFDILEYINNEDFENWWKVL